MNTQIGNKTHNRKDNKPNNKTNKPILIISTCQNQLHEEEFIRPIVDIISKLNLTFEISNYKDMSPNNIDKYSKIIIAGTALKDFDYINYTKKFNWIREIKNNQALLGICAGSHIIGIQFEEDIKKGQEIGSIKIEILKEDKILADVELKESFALHNSYVEVPEGFEMIAKSEKCPQIFKKENKNIYGILFHPEVRDKKIIDNFINL